MVELSPAASAVNWRAAAALLCPSPVSDDKMSNLVIEPAHFYITKMTAKRVAEVANTATGQVRLNINRLTLPKFALFFPNIGLGMPGIYVKCGFEACSSLERA